MDIRFEFCLCGLASAGRMESRASLQGSLQAMLTASRFLKNSKISHEYSVSGGGSDACWEEKSSEIYTDTTYTHGAQSAGPTLGERRDGNECAEDSSGSPSPS